KITSQGRIFKALIVKCNDNSGILAADEEKSPHPSSHQGLRAFNESPMMIFGEDIPILDVPFLHFYPP
ncbi:hypothetical protein Tco_1151874, partial [Tanacetum coccineum]